MPTEIYLLKVGMTMTEGTVDEWYVADGESVEEGMDLYRLETEKVNMDVPAETAGIVKHVVPAGTELEPGDVVGWIFAQNEVIPDVLPTPKRKSDIEVTTEADPSQTPKSSNDASEQPNVAGERVKASPAARRLARERGVSLTNIVGSGPGGRITERDVPSAEPQKSRVAASPAARKLAVELNVDLSLVSGSGPRGRIVKEDIEEAAEHATREPTTVQTGSGRDSAAKEIPIRGMRKTIAERMYQSLRSTAQLTMDMEVSMTEAVRMRTDLVEEWKESGPRVTYTDLVVVAASKALQKHPRMNSTASESNIQEHVQVNIGIAVALADGLIVPVVKDVQSKSLREISIEGSQLSVKARDGKLSLADVADGTFTVTSLGMYGVDTFTPILNAPQSGILGVGRIYDGLDWAGDQPMKVQKMRLSLTWDHRVIDGAPAAEFLRSVVEYLEAPYRLLV